MGFEDGRDLRGHRGTTVKGGGKQVGWSAMCPVWQGDYVIVNAPCWTREQTQMVAGFPTPLGIAAEKGRLDIVKLLAGHNARVNADTVASARRADYPSDARSAL